MNITNIINQDNSQAAVNNTNTEENRGTTIQIKLLEAQVIATFSEADNSENEDLTNAPQQQTEENKTSDEGTIDEEDNFEKKSSSPTSDTNKKSSVNSNKNSGPITDRD